MASNIITLQDVTIELKQANLALDRIDDSTNLTAEFLNLSIDTFKEGFADMVEFLKGNSLANIEREREQAEFNKDILTALQDLKPKYTGPDKREEPKDADFGLGGLLTGLAIAIGTAIGMIRGQIQAIKLFAKALMPAEWIASIRKAIASFVSGLSMGFDVLKASLTDKLSRVGKFLTGTFDDVIKFFSGESKLFSGLKNAFTVLFQPFKELYSMAKGLLSGPFAKVGEWFSSLGQTMTKFSGMIGKVAGIVGKIFLPVTILMTAWDTVKGFIEGFQKDGIIGGISGAIKGFFNSLIFAPIDMLKNATAWVLGFFGFDKAKAFLKSFSFEDIFSSIIDAVFSPIEAVKKLLDGVVSFFTDIGEQISGFFTNFEIPGFTILGKQFGPWKPFAGDTNTTNTTSSVNRSITNNSTQTVTAPSTGGAPGVGATPSAAAPATAGVNSVPKGMSPEEATALRVIGSNAKDVKVQGTSIMVTGQDGQVSSISMISPGQNPQDRVNLVMNAFKDKKNAVGAPTTGGMAIQSGAQLQTAAQENGLLNAAPARPAGAGGANGVQQNNSTTVVNNSTVVVKPIPAATRRPNNSEDIFFGASAGYA